MTATEAAVDFYDRFAKVLAPAYDKVSFEAVHGPLLHHLPQAPAFVLDVGAGSGRDARALTDLGYDVTAVEPASALRELGCARAKDAGWLDDRLPELASLNSARSSFDFILCSAVLMSLMPTQIAPSFKTMARLLRPACKLLISVRSPASTDAEGVLHDHSEAFLNAGAAAAGLKLVDFKQVADALSRPHRWSALVYRHA